MAEEEDKSLEDLLKDIEELTKSVDEASQADKKQPDFYKSLERQSQEAETIVERENREILDMRRQWSGWILFFIGLIIVFDIVLVALYGFGIWNFSDPNVVIVVITENFLKIFGLGYLITQNIFKKIFE